MAVLAAGGGRAAPSRAALLRPSLRVTGIVVIDRDIPARATVGDHGVARGARPLTFRRDVTPLRQTQCRPMMSVKISGSNAGRSSKK